MQRLVLLAMTLLASRRLTTSNALPALSPCEAAANGAGSDRWGICADDMPLSLRGSNYIRLGGPTTGCPHATHTTFDAGVYNRTRFVSALKSMESQGYNIVRVFLDDHVGCGIGGPANATVPLDLAWLDRLAQFIGDAEGRGLYTLITLVRPPTNAFFTNITAQIPQDAAWGGGWNTNFLTARGHAAYETYADTLAAGLKARLAPAAQQAVLVSLQNEFFLQGDVYPFSIRNATVDTLADGVAYNMALPRDRQQAADANTNAWASKLRKAIRAHLPTSLVTVGVFTYNAVHKKGPNGLLLDGCDPSKPPADPEKHVDCRFPARPFWLARSGLDFLDVHIYEADGSPEALAANLNTEEWEKIPEKVPIVMGEFGCNINWYPNATTCAPNVRQLQISSCAAGFTSWLFWTYDSNDVQPDWYGMIDDDGAIDAVLAPVNHADPCKQTA